jgi:hypothetical protein
MVWECSGVTVGRGAEAGRDFFISYTQADRAWAEWMAWVLEEDGHTVLIQAWDFVAGSNWIQGMRAGVSGSARTIAVLSEDYLASEFGAAEWEAAWAKDPRGAGRKLLTVRVKPVERPDFLAAVVSVDLFGIPEAQARTRLRDMVSAAVTGRAKPEKAPGFPGQERVMPARPQFPGVLPRVWKVPPRNPNFTGRGDDLAALARVLAAGPTVTVQAVRGMGGVGKTQLAAEFAYAHAADYDLVYWVAAEQAASIPDQFTVLATELGLDPVPDPEGLQAQVHEALRAVPGWLLIFDNADSVAELRPWLPGGLLPPGIPGHVIVTTRRGGFAAVGAVLDLDVIGPADALVLLRTRVPGLDEATGNELAEELGRLPLGLEQAGAYLDRTGLLLVGIICVCCGSGPRTCSPAARSAGVPIPSPRCGTSASRPPPPRIPRLSSCWTCAPTWHPSASPWTCSPPIRICCPNPSRLRWPMSLGSTTPLAFWSTTRWSSAPRPSCRSTGCCKPRCVPATQTSHQRLGHRVIPDVQHRGRP